MRTWWKLTLAEFRLFYREPQALFFTLAFPLIFLCMFGSIYGNKPSPLLGGRGSVDLSVTGYMAMIIATTGFIGIPTTVAGNREKGILRRLRLTPVRPEIILAAWTALYFVMTLAGGLLLVVAGKLFYGLHFSGNVPSVLLAFTLSTLSLLAVGFLLASLMPTARTANIVGLSVFFPMTFFSGATIPWALLPAGVQSAARALPLTYVVQLLQGLWFGEPWSAQWVRVAVVVGMMAASVALTARVFRWE